MSLAATAWQLLGSAGELYRDSPRAANWLAACGARLAEPVRIAVAGPAGAGKSCVVNALAGEMVAPIEVAGGAGVFAWYKDGGEPAAAVFPPSGAPQAVPVARRDRRLEIDLRQWPAELVSRVLVDWPARGLRDMVLIDTPGQATADWLAGQCDAVVYVTPEPGDDDMRLLRSMNSDVDDGPPVVLALSRADELGAGRIDALTSAKQIARRRRSDPGVHAVCHNVIAVAGLLAATARTLREEEFTALSTLSRTPRAELDGVLLSADRFVDADELRVPMSRLARVELLDRFGVFGIRLASTLVRRGANTHAALAAQLVQRSGISELRESVGRYFLARADVLRGRSALAGLGKLLRAEPRPAAAGLAESAERALASTHDFAESRLLSALECGRLTLPGGLAESAERLLGGVGPSVAERLGLNDSGDPGGPVDGMRAAITDQLAQWRAQAESQLLSERQRAAARVVVRSCEGMLS